MATHDIVWAVVLIGMLVLFRKQLQDAIEEFGNHLGGPPSAMPPLPSSDAHLLLRRSRKEKATL